MKDRGWFVYALGGGWGHLTRAVGLAQAVNGQYPIRILTNSPYADQVRSAGPELDIVLSTDSLEQIRIAEPECLIVDTFPRGLAGEFAESLATLNCTKVLIHRDLNPDYVDEFGLKEFVRAHYDLVIVPGEHEGESFPGQVTRPWRLRGSRDFPHLGVLVCSSGRPEELDWYGAVLEILIRRGIRAHCVAPVCPQLCPPELWIQHWPASDLLLSASVVVGSGGYNTVHECQAHGVPLIGRPWPRMYDRQERRLLNARAVIVQTPEEAAEAAIHAPSWGPRSTGNGADEAVILIANRAKQL